MNPVQFLRDAENFASDKKILNYSNPQQQWGRWFKTLEAIDYRLRLIDASFVDFSIRCSALASDVRQKLQEYSEKNGPYDEGLHFQALLLFKKFFNLCKDVLIDLLVADVLNSPLTSDKIFLDYQSLFRYIYGTNFTSCSSVMPLKKVFFSSPPYNLYSFLNVDSFTLLQENFCD